MLKSKQNISHFLFIITQRRRTIIRGEIMQVIKTVELGKNYDGGGHSVRALHGINMTVEKGDFVAIIGQSGSGKTTLMNILGCLDNLSDGEYYLMGKNVSRQSGRALGKIRSNDIGFVFQGFNLLRSLTARENIELPLRYRHIPADERRRLADAALERVGLSHRADHLPTELSGGQQQRVAIARAIACAPPLILADEPTGNLDSGTGGDIMALFESLHSEGHTIVLITHDGKVADRAARRLTICDGRLNE